MSTLRDRVYKMIEENPDKIRVDIVRHFLAENFSSKTIYRHINDALQGVPLKKKKNSGRPPRIGTRGNITKIKQHFDHKDGLSQRKLAKKFKCDHSTISRILKHKTDIVYFKKTKKPRMSAAQKQKNRAKCRKMLEEYKNYKFVLDDESYFTGKPKIWISSRIE